MASARPVLATVAVATATLMAGALAPSTAAPPSGRSAPPDTFRTVADRLASPLSLAVTGADGLYVAESFAGRIVRQRPGHDPRVVFEGRRLSTAGVSVHRKKVSFATASRRDFKVWRLLGNGKVRELGDVGRFERNRNPDARNTYGMPDLPRSCVNQWPAAELGPHTYTGIVESNPYATETGGRAVYVADAAANTILKVAGGKVRLVAVLPTIPIRITAEAVEAFGLPECVIGETYHFEPVPTDVEKGPDGKLYVSSLPGGPEDGLGKNASVFRVNPRTGAVRQVATGMVTATGLDISRDGDIYVAQLFGGSIVRIPAGSDRPRRYKRVSMPADVEWQAGRIFATTMTLEGRRSGAVESWAD